MLTSFDRAHPLMARIIRMTLVFLLVFWSSFSVQSLVAFGSEGSGSAETQNMQSSTGMRMQAESDDLVEDEPEKTSVAVQVDWDDSGNASGDRPGGVTVRLYADDRATGDALYVTEDDGWLGVFEDLDATDEDGLTIDYTVTADEVDGYGDPAVEPNGDNGYLVTFVQAKISVSVQVIWDDSDDEAGDRPGGVTAHLYAGGEETGEERYITEDDDWLGTFEELDAGVDYTVSFDEVEGYEPTVEPNGENGFLATFARSSGVIESERYDSSKHEDGTLANLDIWKAESEDAETVEEKLTSAADAADGQEAAPIELDGRDDRVILVAVPFWEGDVYTAEEPPSMGSADFVEWEVSGSANCIDVHEDGGILAISGASQGEATITLRLKEDARGLVDPAFYEDHPDEPFEARLTVKVTMPYVSAIEIQRPDGTPCVSGEELSLTKDELKSYAFRAVVRTHDQVTGENANYDVFEGQGLSAASGGLFDDVEWRVLGKDGEPVEPGVAFITEGGVFVMAGDLQEVGYLTVECSSQQGFNGTPASSSVVIGKKTVDPQGDPHPQDTLRVTSNARVSAPQGSSTGSVTGGDGDEAAEGGSSSSGSAPSGASSGASPGASGSSASPKPVETGETIDKTYSLGELEALGSSTGTFNMANAQGPITVTGEGPNLVSILNDAGIKDTSAILSIDFIDYRGVKTSYSWADLTANATRSPLVAVRSYVHADGAAANADDGDGESSENSGESPEPGTAQTMLENTRFRVLTDEASGAIDADALRYINEIYVNVDAGGGQNTGDELKVSIDYTPVEYGKTALLTAIPSLGVGSSKFNLSWQMSKDGTNWTDLDENGSQTLYVVTDDTTIGTYYRVLLETDMVDPETGGYRKAVSDPVQIKTADEDDFYVQLAYTPPPAGELAIFTASPHLAGRTISEYVWEYSQDGGLTWNVIPGEKSPSFSVKTEPVSDKPEDEASEGGEDSEPVVLTYVRVRAIATSGEIAVSNAQPLTVEVGGAGDNPNGGNDSGTVDPSKPQDPTSPTLPTRPDPNPPELPDPNKPTTPSGSKTPTPSVERDNSVEMPRDEASRTQQRPEGSPVPTVAPTTAGRAVEINPEDLIVNPEVTALVQDQQTAIDKAVTESRPGARWTQLNTVEPTSEDIDNILADNPLAPFALPMGLGLIAAGGVEKVLAFRRQTR